MAKATLRTKDLRDKSTSTMKGSFSPPALSAAGGYRRLYTHRPNKSQKACPGERLVRDRDSIRSDRDGLPEQGRGYQAADNSLTTRKTGWASRRTQ